MQSMSDVLQSLLGELLLEQASMPYPWRHWVANSLPTLRARS